MTRRKTLGKPAPRPREESQASLARRVDALTAGRGSYALFSPHAPQSVPTFRPAPLPRLLSIADHLILLRQAGLNYDIAPKIERPSMPRESGRSRRLALFDRGNNRCPICLVPFSRTAVAKGSHATLEHAPPKALRGTIVCLTCRDCNAAASRNIDQAVAIAAKAATDRKAGRGIEVELDIFGTKHTAYLTVGDASHAVAVPAGHADHLAGGTNGGPREPPFVACVTHRELLVLASPQSRTDVVPPRRVSAACSRARTTACAPSSFSSTAIGSGSPRNSRCTWQSMRPGIKVPSEQSTSSSAKALELAFRLRRG